MNNSVTPENRDSRRGGKDQQPQSIEATLDLHGTITIPQLKHDTAETEHNNADHSRRSPIFNRYSVIASLFVGIALIVVGALQFLVYSRQAKIMKVQTGITRQQLDEMRVEQRAWLALTVTPTHLEVYRDRVGGPYISLGVSATNVGKSPARDVTYIPHVYVPTGPRQTGPADLANRLCIRAPFIGLAPLVVPGDIHSQDLLVTFRPQEIQEAWSSHKNALPFNVTIVVCTTFRLTGGDDVHYMAAVTQIIKLPKTALRASTSWASMAIRHHTTNRARTARLPT
jgi:hypothetical protein